MRVALSNVILYIAIIYNKKNARAAHAINYYSKISYFCDFMMKNYLTVRQRKSLENLDKNGNVKDILQKEGIRKFTQDIRSMRRKQLIDNFSYKNSNKVNATLLIKNLIWQAAMWIQQGKMPRVDGNIRSFWYANVKPVLSRLGLSVSGTRFTNDVYYCFVKLRLLGLFTYLDLGFLDERGHARVIGKERGNLILFVEKDGLFSVIRKLALQYGITGISLNGFPSYLTTEFLLKDMQASGLQGRPIKLFSVVDYDPSGYWIEREFVQQFRDYGMEVASVTTLVEPKFLPQDLLETCKYRLRKGTQSNNWLNATGGIAGQAYGMEVDVLGATRIAEAVEREFTVKALLESAQIQMPPTQSTFQSKEDKFEKRISQQKLWEDS